jgi:hypothetical protein
MLSRCSACHALVSVCTMQLEVLLWMCQVTLLLG